MWKNLPQTHQASVLVCPSHQPEQKIKQKKRKNHLFLPAVVFGRHRVDFSARPEKLWIHKISHTDERRARTTQRQCSNPAMLCINTVETTCRISALSCPTDSCLKTMNINIFKYISGLCKCDVFGVFLSSVTTVSAVSVCRSRLQKAQLESLSVITIIQVCSCHNSRFINSDILCPVHRPQITVNTYDMCPFTLLKCLCLPH